MNVLYDFVPQAMFERIGWALFHSLWQATAIAVFLAIALLLLRRRSANVRYVTALVALLLMVAVLPITVALMPNGSQRVTSAELEDSDSVAEVTTSAAAVENAIAAPRPTGAAKPQAVGEGPSQSVGSNKGTETTLQHLARLIQPGLPWAAGSWIGGIVLVSLWHLGGWCSLLFLLPGAMSPAPPVSAIAAVAPGDGDENLKPDNLPESVLTVRPIAAELKKLAEAAMAVESKSPFKEPVTRPYCRAAGIDLSRILKLTGQDKDRANFTRENADFPMVDAWLRVMYQFAVEPSARGEGKSKTIKTPKDRGTLRDAYEKVRGGNAPYSKRDTLLVVPGPKPKDQTPSAWFNGWLKADYDLSADQEKWLLFRSRQLDDADVEWIERIEREGNELVVTANRSIWSGDLKKNITFHNLFGVNLGKLPAGEYTVKWVIRESSFFEIDKDRWPKDAKASKQKPVELKTSFNVLPARKAAPKSKPPAKKGEAGRPTSRKTPADDLRSETIKRTIGKLRHPNQHTRRNAAENLARFGPDAKPAVDELIHALSNKTDDELRMYAARALGAIGPDSRKAVPALRRALSDRENFASRSIRKEAAKALGLIGPKAAGGAVTGLIALLGDDDLYVRRAASQSLGLLGEKAIPDLVRSLGHQNPEIRYRATTALARMRDTSREALEKALKSDDVRVRRGAARAFASYYVLPQHQSVAKLSEHLQDKDPEVRRWIVTALSECVGQSDDALKALLAELKNDNAASFEVVVLLSRTVTREKVLRKLLKALEDGHPPVVRSQLMCAIGLAGPSARKAVPKLKEALKDSRVALRAAEALFRIAPKDKDVQRAVEAYFAKHKLDGLYPGYRDDVRLIARNMDYEGPEYNFSTPEAIRAGRRVFANVGFKGKTKQEVLAILGDPKALSAYARGRCKDIEGKLVYCFATGRGGWEYTLLFKDGRVVSVNSQGLD